jgi:tetratricopeptide (TPR) repeat protein
MRCSLLAKLMSQIATFKLQQQTLGFTSMKPGVFVLLAVLALALVMPATLAKAVTARDFRPQGDSEVIEVLAPRAPRTKDQPATVEDAVAQAKISIQSARELQDPRYLSRARATLQRWWGKADAPQEVLVLQATIEQSLHQFDDARKTLASLTNKYPKNMQAWLTLSSLDRLAGNYSTAQGACERAGQASTSGFEKVYGDLCMADIQCHISGNSAAFRALLMGMNRLRLGPDVLSWGFSLLAECEERSGQPLKALDAYQSSLALAPDNYTSISYADSLLRNKRPEKAMQVLATLPKSDSVLLRVAHAMQMQGMGQWKLIYGDLMQRFQESALRGDDSKQHARERAYAALWLGDDSKQAVVQSKLNIENQKEVIDWVLLFESLEKAKDGQELKRYASILKNTGLRDQRLTSWIAKK